MESRITGIDINDFASFWMNYWFVIDKSEKLKLEKQLRNSGKGRFKHGLLRAFILRALLESSPNQTT